MGLALASEDNPKMFEYFLDPAHHQAGTPLDYISYHFYATPREGENLQTWQYTFWNQAETFLRTVRYAEAIRKRLSPATKVDLDELGAILPEDGKDNDTPGYTAPPPPAKYWNLAGALYAYLYIETAKLGIDIVGESQLVGYHTQYPSVTMIDNANAQPNARFCVLELLKDNFGPGDQLIHTEAGTDDVAVQAFATTRGKRLLLINRRDRMQRVTRARRCAGRPRDDGSAIDGRRSADGTSRGGRDSLTGALRGCGDCVLSAGHQIAKLVTAALRSGS